MAPFIPQIGLLQGAISGRVVLAGTAAAPRGSGRLTLTEGGVMAAGNPTTLSGLELDLDFRGQRVRIDGTGVLGGGPLRLSGWLDTVPEARITLSVQGEAHEVLYPPATSLRLSERLLIDARRDYFGVSGDVTVLGGTLVLEELPEGGVALSRDVVEVDYAGRVLREELPFDTSVDVRVELEKGFTVTGSLLQATLAGGLQLKQDVGKPLQAFGTLATGGGELRAYGQRLVLERGAISFSGPPGDPDLDLRASRQIPRDKVSVGLHVRGRLGGELELDLYSDPTMSQADAMSYLLRGRPMDTGATDGTSLALGMVTGVVNRSTLVSNLNRVPGVSDINFGAEGSGENTAATLSGYIGERLYLSYGLGVYEPISTLTARLYLQTRLWLEVVSRLENSVDLYYAFDID